MCNILNKSGVHLRGCHPERRAPLPIVILSDERSEESKDPYTCSKFSVLELVFTSHQTPLKVLH